MKSILTKTNLVLGIVTAAILISSAVWMTTITTTALPSAFATAIGGDGDDDDSLAERIIDDVNREIDETLSELPTISPLPTTGPVRPCASSITIVGTEGDDTIVGTENRDIIDGRGGDDSLVGLGGDDLICGNDGNDIIDGGDGPDRMFGNDGNDHLVGKEQVDFHHGDAGDDLLDSRDGV
jgi:Ca2+-binding RTX toxin-like protein